MISKPFFSIITCTYNSADFLEKNINSVKEQNFTDYEHIFIDGFSTDNTEKMILKYQTEFPNQVKYFKYQPKGISKAMNQGVENSNGEYLIHLHSDDSFFDNNVLSDVSSFLTTHDFPEWIYGQINVVQNNKSIGIFPTKKLWQKEKDSHYKNILLKLYNYIPHQAVFIKKTVFDNYGYFDTSLKSNMDMDLWLRIYDKTRWIFLKRIISNYQLRADAQSSGFKNKKQNTQDLNMVRIKHLSLIQRFFAHLADLVMKVKNNYQK